MVRAVARLVIESEAPIAVRIATLDAQLLSDLFVAEDAIHRHDQFTLEGVGHHLRVPRILVSKPGEEQGYVGCDKEAR